MGSLKDIATKSATKELVSELRSHDQDFEFYPTTKEQLNVIRNDLEEILKENCFHSKYREKVKILDVGAGDGRALFTLSTHLNELNIETKMFAIEKAMTHTSSYVGKNISVIGTDFEQTNFISKNADLVFTNPPYLHYERWIYTLIKQMKFKLMYAVIPERWVNCESIKEAMERMNIHYKILAESDFVEADRVSRAKVNVIRFSRDDFESYSKRKARFKNSSYKNVLGSSSVSPFQVFINDELGLKKNYSESTKEFNILVEKQRVSESLSEEGSEQNKIMVSRGVLNALLDSYEKDLERTLGDYKKISTLDPSLLKELGVDYDNLVDGVKQKLFGYRNVYWSLLFDNLDVLYRKLTQKNKVKLLDVLNSNALDFTYNNAVYIIDYAVKMANDLIEDSIIHVYKKLTSEKSILRHYKSNTHHYQDKWRYNNKEQNDKAKYLLDYRFISSHFNNFSSYSWEKGLIDDAREYISDIVVAMSLIGYDEVFVNVSFDEINPGDSLTVQGYDVNKNKIDLVVVKFYKNGNRHLKFNQEAMLRFNVMVSRLLGWVRDKGDFVYESEVKDLNDNIWSLTDGLKILPSFVFSLADKR